MATRSTLVLRDATTGQTWNLTEGRLVIARKDALSQLRLDPGDQPLALDDQLVSRRHAVIQAADGLFSITDAGSRDGTYLNDREIHETTPVADGDRLRFGDSVLVVSTEEVAPPPPPLVEDAPRPRQIEPPGADSVLTTPSITVDVDRTVFQPPVVTRRPAEPSRPVAPPPPEITQPRPAPPPPSTPAQFTPVPRPPGQAAPVSVAPSASTPAPVSVAPSAPVPAPVSVAPPASTPAPVSVAPSPPTTSAPVSVAPSAPQVAQQPRRAGSQVVRLADVSAALLQLQRDLATAVEIFEQAGGRIALLTFINCARRAEANPGSPEDIEMLLRWLPTARLMLEAELAMVDLVSFQPSDAPR